MNDLEKRTELTPRRRALLQKLLEAQGVAPADASPLITRRRDDGPPPLSFAQERLWFLDQLEPARAFYNVPQAFRLKGPLNIGALERTLSEIVRRHEILRTTFGAGPHGAPVQWIAEAEPVELPILDLQGFGEPDRWERARELANEEARAPFDLARGPLMRARLLRLGAEDHVLLFSLHHIVSDAWSSGILFLEVAALYDAYSRGEPSPLSELPVQYADFAICQREWLQGAVLDEQLAYWKETLGGAPPLLQLPADRPRPTTPTYRGAHRPVSIPPALADGLRALSRREGATVFMTLLAAFQSLVHRLTGRHDVLVGSLIANRNRIEVEELIGFFANTLVLRSDLSGDPTFRQLLGRVRETTLEAYAHQDLPFERLVSELSPDRDPRHHPLFQVMFVLQSRRDSSAELTDLAVSSIGTETGISRFDLMLSLEDGPEEILGSIEYSTELFDGATIQRWWEQWCTLLEGIVADPDARLSDLLRLPEPERRRVVEDWNDTEVRWSRALCAHELFEEQVARTPDAIAVVFEEDEVSYRELNASANRLARHLRGLGVERGSVVAIHMERSLDLIVAVLGALKARGACLALDPSWPRERLAFMLAESDAALLLTQERLGGSLHPGEAAVVRIDAQGAELARQQGTNLESAVGPDDLAYVVYTSGSTGRPKGIGMPHRALANLVEWHRHAPSSAARVLQFAALSFDVSFQEIFSCLASGATLVLPREATRLDPGELGRFIGAHRIQRAHLPNAILYRLAEEFAEDPAPLEGLKEIMVGGEQLQVGPALRTLFERLKGCALFNHYGPSESHVVTSFPLPADPAAWPALPPLGRPISNTLMYVLDARLHPVPVGVTGELFIAGPCLARGYLNRPDLTAERFLPDPLGTVPGARMYRSGDLVRWLADGNLDFLGRADAQIKIRGMRIEPGEIETALVQHPMVKEAVIVARRDVPGKPQLVAYVVPGPGTAPSVADLRDHLRRTLPEVMIPTCFVTSEAFPRTPNGKIDRAALPPPGRDSETSAPRTPPRGPVEEKIAAIWREVLELESVGVEDSFFDLGGHSLLVTRVLSRLRGDFGAEVLVRRFFEAPTIAALAATIEGREGVAAATGPPAPAPLIPSLPRGSRGLEGLLDEMDEDRPGAVKAPPIELKNPSEGRERRHEP